MKKLEEKIVEALDYYVEDPPNRRCKTNSGTCRYSGNTLGLSTIGCFVGYFLTLEQRTEWDEKDVGSLNQYKHANVTPPPDFISENMELFLELQRFHDNMSGLALWNAKGLTTSGVDKLKEIIKEFKLEISYFEKYFN